MGHAPFALASLYCCPQAALLEWRETGVNDIGYDLPPARAISAH